MQTWLEIEEFAKLVHLERETVLEMVERGKISSKKEDGKILIEAIKGAGALIPSKIVEAEVADLGFGGDFVEKTIGTILNLHEKVLDAKDETLDAMKSENRFLKEALFSLQELYDEDRKTIETLTTQLKICQEELEFTRRKYKLMWNETVEKYAK